MTQCSPETEHTPLRDFDKRPYSPDEQRVAAFLSERGAGGGYDPIGFILASYAYVVHERNELRGHAQSPTADQHDAIYSRGWNEGIDRAIELLEAGGSATLAATIRTLLEVSPVSSTNRGEGA